MSRLHPTHFTMDREMPWKRPRPRVPCVNHPDREAHAFYRDGNHLCMECFEKRFNSPERERTPTL